MPTRRAAISMILVLTSSLAAAQEKPRDEINYGDARLNPLVMASKDAGRDLDEGDKLVIEMEARVLLAEEAFSKELGKFACFFISELGVMREAGIPVKNRELLEDWLIIKGNIRRDDGIEEVSKLYETLRITMKKGRAELAETVRQGNAKLRGIYSEKGVDASPWRTAVAVADFEVDGCRMNEDSPLTHGAKLAIHKGQRIRARVERMQDGSELRVGRTSDNQMFMLVSESFRARIRTSNQLSEKDAATKLGLAKSLKKQGKTAGAFEYLHALVEEYPETAAAEEAASLLKSWRSKLAPGKSSDPTKSASSKASTPR